MNARRQYIVRQRIARNLAKIIRTTSPFLHYSLIFILGYLMGQTFTSCISVHAPVPDILDGIQVVATPTPTPMPAPVPAPTKYKGKASYYSTTGCVGCSSTLTMADGSILDDTRLTVAFNRAPLGTVLLITNTENKIYVHAVVTDRGGFERHGKIADLSVATKEAIGCGDVCDVEISF